MFSPFEETDTLELTHTAMPGRYIVLGIAIVLILVGIFAGDFIETWRNGATL